MYIITLSIFSLTAHIRAMEPILFVIVTSVARAKSSFVTVFLRSLEFICPKLKTGNKKRDCDRSKRSELHYLKQRLIIVVNYLLATRSPGRPKGP